MPVLGDLEPDELEAWRFDCKRTGRELPCPARFRPAPRAEKLPGEKQGALLDPTRPAVIAVYPDGTFPTTGMPPIFGTVCGSYRPPDPADYPDTGSPQRFTIAGEIEGQRIADEIRQRYANRLVTNGNQLTARQQATEDAAVGLWLESRIGRAAQARDDWQGAADEWDRLQELTRDDFRNQARKLLKETKDDNNA